MDRDRAALSRRATLALVAAPAAFAALFFAYPLVAILERSLVAGGRLDVPWDTLTRASTVRILLFTTWQALGSTALTLAAGLPLAWVVGRFRFRGRGLVRALVLVPFVLPTIVVATAFVALLPEGLERGILAILAAHVFFNVAVVVRIVGGYWAGLAPSAWQAAAVLGAGPWRRTREITLPLLLPALSAAAAITFLFCFTSFGVVLVLGGPGRATLETEIYNQAARAFDLPTAATLALVQLAAVAVALAAATALERRLPGERRLLAETDVLRVPRGRERRLVWTILAVTGAALALPVAMLVARSLDTAAGVGLRYYRRLAVETPALLVPPWETAVNSLAFAAVATAAALAVGIPVAVALARTGPGLWDWVVLLPLGTSAVMLGFGFLIAFDDPPLDFRRSWLLVPVAQSLVAVPFVIRVVTPTLRAVDPALRDAAAVLGASPARALREVDLRLAARAAAGAAGIAFAVSLGEFGATVFLSRAENPTLPVAIFRFLGRAGADNQGQAAALATLLAALTAFAVLLTERLARIRRTAL